MTPRDAAGNGSADEEDAVAEIETGRRGQRLICEAWFASHADSGTPGPHIHLRTSDRRALVLRSDQIPNLMEALSVVAERIARQWAEEGDEYAENVVLQSPDPQDPDVVRRMHVHHMRFMQRVAENLPEVTRLLSTAESTDEALASIAPLLRCSVSRRARSCIASRVLTCSVSLARPTTDGSSCSTSSPRHDGPASH
jgi:hypothetical protein